MSYERRRNALVRLGAPPCERCRRPAPDRQLIAAPRRFLPDGHVYAQEGREDPIAVAMCCQFCRKQVEREREFEKETRERERAYKQQQHEIRMHQIRMERARYNPEYVRGCLQMQNELKDILGRY